MASQIDIINRALVKLGQNTITSLDENNTQAQAMSAIYDLERRSLLRQYRWSFARARASLAALSVTPDFGYKYKYQLPADCLQLISVYQSQPDPNWNNYNSYPQQEYVIEGRQILTDREAPIEISYVKDVENTGDFDPAFNNALSDSLAETSCMRITQSNSLKAQMTQDKQISISFAIRSNAIELPAQGTADTTWTLVRT